MSGGRPVGTRIAHVVLRVRDVERSLRFYRDLLGMRETARLQSPPMVFLAFGESHHDLALMEVGPQAPGPDPRAVGMYHFAIQVPTWEELRAAYRRLREAGARILGAADHRASRSVYVADPDGIEVELEVDAPEEVWRGHPEPLTVLPLEGLE